MRARLEWTTHCVECGKPFVTVSVNTKCCCPEHTERWLARLAALGPMTPWMDDVHRQIRERARRPTEPEDEDKLHAVRART